MPTDADRRSLSRYQLGAKIEVINQLTGVSLGILVDVHLEGLMLMGAEQLQPEHLYQVKLQPAGVASDQAGVDFAELELGLECLWTRSMAQEGRFWAGCRIIDISSDASLNLEQLILAFGQNLTENSTATL